KTLHVANCRFVTRTNGRCIGTKSHLCELRNCELLCAFFSATLHWEGLQSGHRLVMDNCLHTAGVGIEYGGLDANPPTVQITRSTFGSVPWVLTFGFPLDRAPELEGGDWPGKALLLQASANVFDGGFMSLLVTSGRLLTTADAERYLARLIDWR